MGYYKTMICLANSRKLGGRCIAGRELESSGFGEWIRVVANSDGGELQSEQTTDHNGKQVEVLDIVRIPFEKLARKDFQTENRVVDHAEKWLHVGALAPTSLTALCDSAKTLWINGYSSPSGMNDRIPEETAKRCLHGSLLLIRPERLALCVVQENKRKVKADFSYNKVKYRLVVTDPIIEAQCLSRKNGVYPCKSRDVYLCISLGEPYNGFTYKLVASVIILSLKKA